MDCDPVGQTGCSADRTCHLFFRTDAVWTDCVIAGAAPRSQACDEDGDCSKGLFCPQAECTPYCSRSGPGPNACGAGFKCQELAAGDVRLGDTKIGFCRRD